MFSNNVFRLLFLSFVLWGAAFYSSIESTVAIWYRSETFAHCFIILPICIYLIKQNWSKLSGVKIQPNLLVLPIVVVVLILWLFGNLAQVLVIEQGAAFLMLPMIIWTLLGNQAGIILLFPMYFWMFSVPVGEFLIPHLQEITADIAVWSIQISGVPVYRDGLYISVPNGIFEVAVACSGIRYLIAMFTFGNLYAYLNYKSNKKRLIFVFFSLVIPLLANGIRAFGIVIIAYLSDMKYGTGFDHLVYGWLFFGGVLFAMLSIGGIWSDPVLKDEQNENVSTASVFPKVKFLGVLLALVLTVGISLGYKAIVKNPKSDFIVDTNLLFDKSTLMEDESWLPHFENADLELKGSSEGVDYFVAFYRVNEQGKELINSKNKLFNINRWSVQSRGEYEQFRTITITNVHGQKRLLAYTYVNPWFTSASAMKFKLVQAMDAFAGQPQLGLFVMLSVAIEKDEQDIPRFLKAAELKLNNTLQDVLNESR